MIVRIRALTFGNCTEEYVFMMIHYDIQRWVFSVTNGRLCHSSSYDAAVTSIQLWHPVMSLRYDAYWVVTQWLSELSFRYDALLWQLPRDSLQPLLKGLSLGGGHLELAAAIAPHSYDIIAMTSSYDIHPAMTSSDESFQSQMVGCVILQATMQLWHPYSYDIQWWVVSVTNGR